MKKKDETVIIFSQSIPKWKDCPDCKRKLVCEFSPLFYGYRPRCLKCQEKRDTKDEKEREKRGGSRVFMIGKQDAVAFGVDKKTGRPVAISAKGKIIDASETRYDLKNDPRGWKATGKKVRSKDNKGRENNR